METRFNIGDVIAKVSSHIGALTIVIGKVKEIKINEEGVFYKIERDKGRGSDTAIDSEAFSITGLRNGVIDWELDDIIEELEENWGEKIERREP